MINLMIYLNGIEESGEGEKFVGSLLSYMDNKIKSHSYKNITLSMWWI